MNQPVIRITRVCEIISRPGGPSSSGEESVGDDQPMCPPLDCLPKRLVPEDDNWDPPMRNPSSPLASGARRENINPVRPRTRSPSKEGPVVGAQADVPQVQFERHARVMRMDSSGPIATISGPWVICGPYETEQYEAFLLHDPGVIAYLPQRELFPWESHEVEDDRPGNVPQPAEAASAVVLKSPSRPEQEPQDCPRPRDQDQIPPAEKRPARRLQVHISGHAFVALLDFDLQQSVLSPAVIQCTDRKYKATPSSPHGTSSGNHPTRVRAISLEGRARAMAFRVVPHTETEVLLGRDFLREMHMNVDFLSETWFHSEEPNVRRRFD